MNSFIETLNQWGENFLSFAWPMFWQSSLLITVLVAFDFLFGRKLRASIRYTLWLVVLVKLCVPPTLASPTSPAWWIHKTPPPIVVMPESHYTVTYDNSPLPEIPQAPLPVFVPPKPVMTFAAWSLIFSASISSALLLWLLVRWWQITWLVRQASSSERLAALMNATQRFIGTKFKVRVKLTTGSMSPAVCGLFRQVVLIPQSLVENFSDEQLRAVLLHELIHLRRRDVWVNFLQALLQIFYWWHPLVWLANARIRRVREEAVDDAVMLALRDEAESYAPTLLEVAKLALSRPLASLGLVGIMESRHALRQRIERLVDFRAPRHAGLTLVSLLGILAFTAVAVPMGEGPAPTEKQTLPVPPVSTPAVAAKNTNAGATNTIGILTDPNFREQLQVYSAAYNQIMAYDAKEQAKRGTFNYETGTFDDAEVKLKAGGLVQDGKLLFEMGKLDEAEAKLKAALALEPENATAKYYLGAAQTVRQTLSGRQKIIAKLDRIRLAQVSFEHATLEEVVRQLNKATEKSDPEKIGVSFFIATNSGSTDLTDVNSIGVTLNLKDMRLTDVLDAIILAADKPIKYSIQDDGIVFSPKSAANSELITRTFKVDKNAFYSSLKQTEGVDARTAINSSVTASALARKFFNSLGVNMESPSGKAVFFRDDTDFFNDKSGTLFVKATTADLDLIEKAIQTINHIAPQIHIKARFLEVSEKTFQDFVVPHLFTNAADKSETNVLRGFLTDKQFVNMLRTLEKKSGFEIFAEPEAVTTSCRQLQMRATQIISIITNFTFHSTFQSTNFMSSKATRTNSTLVPQVSTVETGPILDVVPCVFADGYTINLAAIPSVTEFLGYDTTTNLNVLYNEAGEKVDVPKISPRIRVRQAVATANLWDGQTLVIGGLTSLPVLATTDKVPLSAQSQSKTNIEKAVLVFITATIVDPAGNRIHTDDELPFAKDGFPVQPPPPPQRGWKIFPR